MSHRLLHTLVFASTSLLACGGTILEEATDAAPGPDASPDVASDADKRICEAGWPTTKGQICTFEAGITCCQPMDDDAGITVCCEQP